MKLSITSLDYLNSDVAETSTVQESRNELQSWRDSEVSEFETLNSVLAFEDMEVDNDDDSPNNSSLVLEEMEVDYDDDWISSHNLILNVAAQADSALLDSGFVRFDPVSSTKLDLFHPPDISFLTSSSSPLHYTTPRVLVLSSKNIIVQTVSVKFQSAHGSVDIIGSLTNKDDFIYKVNLKFSRDWKRVVKDKIAWPLLVDLCESVGLVPPACFMVLHSDLKIKILESLPGVEIAKVGRVCAEMRSIVSSNDQLWRRKFEQEFPNLVEGLMGTKRSWKEEFASAWMNKLKRNPFWHVYMQNPYRHSRGRDIWRENLVCN